MTEQSEATFLDEVIRVCGSAVALKLVVAFGGGVIYFSQAAAEHHQVAKVIGADQAALIAKHVGYGRQWVPCRGEALVALVRSARRESVCGHLKDGQSRRWIAKRLRCTQRTVYRDVAWLRERGLLP